MVTIEELKSRSQRAICGAAEREVTIDTRKAAEAIRLIKSKGFMFIGSGPAGMGRTKIWYVARGSALL